MAGATSATTTSSTASAGSGKAATAASPERSWEPTRSGYNEYSFALSAIGNYDVKGPPAAVLNAYARLFAWKLSLYNIRADNPRVYVKNKYFRAISGHRDAGQTACPGRYLYAKLPSIRKWAQSIQNKAQTSTPTPSADAAHSVHLADADPAGGQGPTEDHDVPADQEPERGHATPTSRSRTPRAR